MKLGIICPTPHLDQFASLSDFHLVLPHLYDDPRYKEFYKDKCNSGDFVTQDNSVFELTNSLPIEVLIEKGNDIGVSEVVVKEVLGNGELNYLEILNSLEYCSKVNNKIPLMAVVQGSNIDSFIDYFFRINEINEISSLSIPFAIDYTPGNMNLISTYNSLKSLTMRRFLNRCEVVKLIDQEAKKRNVKIKDTHLLGLSDGVELQFYKNYSWIRSNDSSSAFVHGAAGILYTEKGLPCEKISTKLDFNYKLTTEDQENAVFFNIKKLKEFVI